MTALSPRLAHLLIREDRDTGKLVRADGTCVKDTREQSTDRKSTSLSPPLSPMSLGFEPSPVDHSKPLAPLLPVPRGGRDRRPSQGIFSLLNETRPVSPLSPLSGPSTPAYHADRPHTANVIRKTSSSSPLLPGRPTPQATEYTYVPPHTAPIHPASFDSRGHFLAQQRRAPVAPGQGRPDMFRRHSAHPYDSVPETASRPSTSYVPREEYSSTIGSRAPISRTTKACNGCRSRKVRCDAGGLPNGEPATCGRCRESGIACVYSGPQKKRGPCPGTVRQISTSAKSRRPSHRSSVTSVATSFVTTPPSEDDPEPSAWSSRSSYGFPAPGQPYYPVGKRPNTGINRTSPTGRSQPIPVLSWPEMRPAIEVDAPKVVFHDDYSMRPHTSSYRGREDRSPIELSLPPLRVAIETRENYYARA